MAEVIKITDRRMEETIHDAESIEELRFKVNERQEDNDANVIYELSSVLTLSTPLINGLLTVVGVFKALDQQKIASDLEDEEDLYTSILGSMAVGDYDLVKLEQEYCYVEIYTEDGGLVYEGWIKDELPSILAIHSSSGWKQN
ncbi:hypothetical protein [Caldisalinibacter kiritimatiensis]|uniref:Uncharacterized protein n=1 Tax=Caldisalinibacter kiritimatiensis TaxID=1304284 RepID=R1CXS0_9FIRM|nr:hypothetical protein [Caldisalinibacter kiritimatiensis]EOD01404.1 hypothetical protein L21TH_0526 [Caldisalinibacter kiritimatiensis]